MKLKVHSFEDEFEKWFNAKKKRFNVIKMKYYFTVYDYIKYDVIKDNEGEHLMFDEKSDAEILKNFLNTLWEEKLKKIYDERMKNANIWEPMFVIRECDL